MKVETLHPEYQIFSPRWQRIQDALSGGAHIKNKKQIYLPKLESEGNDEYDMRIRLAKWYDAASHTLDMWAGMLLWREPDIVVDEAVREIIHTDITNSQDDLNSLVQEILNNQLGFSRAGVLVDYSNDDKRAYISQYGPFDIINWRGRGRIGDADASLVVLRENQVESNPNDIFSSQEVERYRVLRLDENGKYLVEIYERHTESGNCILVDKIEPTIRGERLDFIPFRIIGKKSSIFECQRSPIETISDLAFHYYLLSASFHTGLHYVALPTPVIIGAGVDAGARWPIGPQQAWILPEGGDAKYLSYSGDGLQLLSEALEVDKREMADVGARVMEAKATNVAARTLQIKTFSDAATLLDIGNALSSALTTVLKWYHRWEGRNEKNVSFKTTTDFLPPEVDPNMIRELVSAVQAGLVSREEFFEIIRRADMVPYVKTFDDHQEQIKEDDLEMARPAVAAPDGALEPEPAPPGMTPGKTPPKAQPGEKVLT